MSESPEKLAASESDLKDSDNLLLESIFANRYQILSILGDGASARVYAARDMLLDRPVALKVIHRHLISNLKAVQRFKEEALNCTSLSHPSIARVYNQGQTDEGRLYLVMDLLEGISLARLIEEKGRLEPEIFFRIFSQLIDALKYAHQQNIVHRDIKPSNIIILDKDDPQKLQAILVDFGLAKLAVDEDNKQDSTRTAAIMGSTPYMSPEQCLNPADVDARSDIYSLACVMVEALTGKAPFQGDSAYELMYKHLNESLGQLAFLKDLPGALSGLLAKCLNKDRNKRFQNMDELSVEFKSCHDLQDTLRRRLNQSKNSSSKSPSILLVLGTLLVLAVISAGFIISKQQSKTSKETKELMKHSKELPAVETVKLPGTDRGLSELVRTYNEAGRQEDALTILKNWDEAYKNKKDFQELRALAWAHMVNQYCYLNDEAKMLEYANKVLDSDYANTHIETVCGTLSLYGQKNARTEFLLQKLNELFSRHKKLNNSEVAQLVKLRYMAIAYESVGKYKEAAALHERFIAQTRNELDQGSRSNLRLARLRLIKDLSLSNQNETVAGVIDELLSSESDDSIKALGNMRDLALVLGDSNKIDLAIKYFNESRKQLYVLLKGASKSGDKRSEEIISDLIYNMAFEQINLLTEQRDQNGILNLLSETLPCLKKPDQKLHVLNALASTAYQLGKTTLAQKYMNEGESIVEQILKGPNEHQTGHFEDMAYNLIVTNATRISYAGNSSQTAQLEQWIGRLKAYNCTLKIKLRIRQSEIARTANNIEQAESYQQKAEAALKEADKSGLIPKSSTEHALLEHSVKLSRTAIFVAQKRYEEAARSAQEAADCVKGTNSDIEFEPQFVKVDILRMAGKSKKATELLAKLESKYKSIHPICTYFSIDSLCRMASLYSSFRQYEKAESLLTAGIKDLSMRYKNIAFVPLSIYQNLASVYHTQNKGKENCNLLKPRLDLAGPGDKNSPYYLPCVRLLAHGYMQEHNFSEAEKVLNQAENVKCSDTEKIHLSAQKAALMGILGNHNARDQALRDGLAIVRRLKVPDTYEFEAKLKAEN